MTESGTSSNAQNLDTSPFAFVVRPESGELSAAKQRIGPDPATWYCKIGEVPRGLLPDGSDLPMREAIARAYREITGRDPVFIFSGWGAELTEPERAVIENRAPRV